MNIFISGGNKNGKSGYAQDAAVKLAAEAIHTCTSMSIGDALP